MNINPFLVFVLIAFLFTSVNGENWSVEVGKGGKNVFVPDNFDVNMGDTVIFSFVGGTHDVVQEDAPGGKCAKSLLPGAFSTPINTGSAASPPQVSWLLDLPKAGTVYYYCSVADHCAVGKMFAKINVLEAGAKLVAPGVKAPNPPAKAPAQPGTPADDLPNIPPSSKPPPPSGSPTTPGDQPKAKSSAVSDKQIPIAIIGGALLSSFLI